MKIYFKYLLKSQFLPFLVITCTLSGIAWITQSSKLINLIVSNGITTTDFLKLSLYLMPFLLFIILPIGLLFSTTYLLNTLDAEKETVALKSIGLSNFQIAKPFIVFSLFILVLSYIISFWLLPISYKNFKELQLYFRNNYASLFLEEKVFETRIKDLTLYVDEKESGFFKGIMVHDARDDANYKTIIAKTGEIKNAGDGMEFILYNGLLQAREAKTGKMSFISFDRYLLDMHIEKESGNRSAEYEEKFIHELFDTSGIGNESKWNKMIAHAHQRIAFPLQSLVVVMVVVVVMLRSIHRRKKSMRPFVAVTIASLFIINTFLAYNNAQQDIRYLPNMYLNVLIPIIVCFSLLFKNHKKIFLGNKKSYN